MNENFKAKVCATQAGPCVEAEGSDPVKVAVTLGLVVAAAYGGVKIVQAVFKLKR